jgi:hypothetical protein
VRVRVNDKYVCDSMITQLRYINMSQKKKTRNTVDKTGYF